MSSSDHIMFVESTVDFILEHENRRALVGLFQKKKARSRFYGSQSLAALKTMMKWCEDHNKEPFNSEDFEEISKRLIVKIASDDKFSDCLRLEL